MLNYDIIFMKFNVRRAIMEKTTSNSLAENKVSILYVLDKIDRDITESNLFKFVSPINNINYFYFKQILTDLVDSKLIETYTKDEEEEKQQAIYKLTTEGRDSLNLTIDILPGLKKLRADTVMKDELSNMTNENSIITEYIPEDEKSYTVKCKIVEDNKTIFEVRTYAGSNEQAKLISDNWKKNAYTLYPKILGLLTENID